MSGPTMCPATNRKGVPCGNVAGFGTDHVGFGHCKFHGGLSPNGRAHAAKLEAKADAVRLGVEAPVTAPEALEWSIRIIGGEVRFLQAKVAELDNALASGGADLHPLARALGSSAERLARVSKLGVDADLDGKRLALDALVLDRISTAIGAAITDAGLSTEDNDRLKAALADRLRELATESEQQPRLKS